MTIPTIIIPVATAIAIALVWRYMPEGLRRKIDIPLAVMLVAIWATCTSPIIILVAQTIAMAMAWRYMPKEELDRKIEIFLNAMLMAILATHALGLSIF